MLFPCFLNSPYSVITKAASRFQAYRGKPPLRPYFLTMPQHPHTRTDPEVSMDYTYLYPSPLGEITLASNGTQLTGLWFKNQKYFGSTLCKDHVQQGLPIFKEACRWLRFYFKGDIPGFTPPLSLGGTPFYKAIWEILLTVPYGHTVTYGEIAKRYAQQQGIPSMSPQAVGNAVAHNPISLIIPCHRVVGSNGSLTGYAGGIEKKTKLLALERVGLPPCPIPTR